MLPIRRGFLIRSLLKSPASIGGELNLPPSRGYKNFGHKREIVPLVSQCFALTMFGGLVFSVIDWRWCRMLYLHYTNQLQDNSKKETSNNRETSD